MKGDGDGEIDLKMISRGGSGERGMSFRGNLKFLFAFMDTSSPRKFCRLLRIRVLRSTFVERTQVMREWIRRSRRKIAVPTTDSRTRVSVAYSEAAFDSGRDSNDP